MILHIEQYHEFLNQAGFYHILQEGISSWEQQFSRLHVPPYFKEMKQAIHTLYFQSLQKTPPIVLPKEEILAEILRDILGLASDVPITNKDYRNPYRSVACLLQYYFNYFQLSHLDPENIILITRESLQRLLQMEYLTHFLLNTYAQSPFLNMFQKTTQNIFQEVGYQGNGAAFLLLHSSFKTLRTRIQELEEKRIQAYNQLSEGYIPREDWQKQTQYLLDFLDKMEQAKYNAVEVAPSPQVSSSSRFSATGSFPMPILSPLPEEKGNPSLNSSPIPKPTTTRFQTFPRPATQRFQPNPNPSAPTPLTPNSESQRIQPKYPTPTTQVNLNYTFSPAPPKNPTPIPSYPQPNPNYAGYIDPYATGQTPVPYAQPQYPYPNPLEQTPIPYNTVEYPYPNLPQEQISPPNSGPGFGKLAELYPNLMPSKSPPIQPMPPVSAPPFEIKAKNTPPILPTSSEKTTKNLRPVKGFSKKLTKKTSLSQLLAQQEEKPQALQKKQHLVLIDPDQENLYALQNQLEQNGFSITAFSQGKKALDYLLVERPHLVISETLLDQIDGFTLLNLVKNKKGDAFPTFIFYTHVNDPSWIQQALQMGATDYLLKPLHFDVLLTKLSVYLAKTSSGPEKTETYSGLSGSLSEAALEDILMMISKMGKDTCLHLQEKEMQGKVFFQGGEILHAETEGYQGLPAIVQFLTWKEGSFFCNTEDRTTETSLAHIPLEYMLLEAARMMDEKGQSEENTSHFLE